MRLGIVEAFSEFKGPAGGTSPNIHYLPHHGVVHLSSHMTKLRIVYDGSTGAHGDICSLNDHLQKGPNYIPKLFEVLVKFRWHSKAVTADIEKIFLMVGIKEADHDFLRFLWFKESKIPHSKMVRLQFSKLIFGLQLSPACMVTI